MNISYVCNEFLTSLEPFFDFSSVCFAAISPQCINIHRSEIIANWVWEFGYYAVGSGFGEVSTLLFSIITWDRIMFSDNIYLSRFVFVFHGMRICIFDNSILNAACVRFVWFPLVIFLHHAEYEWSLLLLNSLCYFSNFIIPHTSCMSYSLKQRPMAFNSLHTY